jgi:hypothetical protein
MEVEPEEAGPTPHSPTSEPDSASIPAPPPDPEHETNGNDQSSASSITSRPISGVVPPYWQCHNRSVSHASQSSLHGITLEDHTADPDSETSRGLWARSVSIDDHVVVQGMTGVGSYVVWNCRIQTLDVSYSLGVVGVDSNAYSCLQGGPIVVRMRFVDLLDGLEALAYE